MKKLTRKFKENFRSYDCTDQDINVLILLLDLILDMMNIVTMEDHDDIKTLSSFVNILSSGYKNVIIDNEMVENIYVETILPILDSFDRKYSQDFVAISTKEIVNGIPQVAVITNKNDIETVRKSHDNIDVNETKKTLHSILERRNNTGDSSYDYSNEDIINLNNYIAANFNTDNSVVREAMFHMIKDIVSKIQNIYDYYTSGRYRNKTQEFMKDLVRINDIMSISRNSDDTRIQLISDIVQDLAYALIDEMNKNQIIPPSSVMQIELKFKAIEEINYNENINVNI